MDQVTKKIRIEALIPFDEVIHAKKNLALAVANGDREDEKARFKPLARAHVKRIKELDADISRLTTEVLKGAAKGWVDADERWDWDAFEVTTIRCDTAEIVGEPRPMSAEERREPPLVDIDAASPPRDPPKQVKIKRAKKDEDGAAPTH